MSDTNEKIKVDGPDFEGHKLPVEKQTERADDAGEPDFEGHKLTVEKLVVEKLTEE